MSKSKLHLAGLSDGQLVHLGTIIKSSISIDPASVSQPSPTVHLSSLLAAAQNQMVVSEKALLAARQATTDKELALDALRTGLVQLMTHMEASGDASKILRNFLSIDDTETAAFALRHVFNLHASAGDHPGQIDLAWDPVPASQSYDIQISADPMSPPTWKTFPPSRQSKTTLTGLVSGHRVWARVRAVNASGSGPWSDAATKIVP
ncbi:MAG: fibronectin type III domain-containing protein [Verrucomicrobiota bacterium]